MSERQIKIKRVDRIRLTGNYDGEPVTKLTKALAKARRKYGKDLLMEVFCDDDGSYCSLSLYVERPETDEEYANRIRLDEARERQQEERERAQLAYLKEKYENAP